VVPGFGVESPHSHICRSLHVDGTDRHILWQSEVVNLVSMGLPVEVECKMGVATTVCRVVPPAQDTHETVVVEVPQMALDGLLEDVGLKPVADILDDPHLEVS
jgi:hypothetical protein